MAPMRKSHKPLNMLSQGFTDFPASINISLWWNYGSLLGLFLTIQIISGIVLSMHYCPNTELAFSSLVHITRNVNLGWMLHNVHMNGASVFLLLMYTHMARSMYYMSFYMMKTWNTGVTIFILTMMTAFMGYVLPWGQMSFWAATVITNMFSAVPYLGTHIVKWLWGGFAVTGVTLNRFFILYFLLPFSILLFMVLHFMMLHKMGSNNPLGINSNSDRTSFHIYFTLKDLLGFMMSILLLLIITTLYPNILLDPENFTEANPMLTPNHIQPEWYFLWLYAILRSVPNKLGGVAALLLAIMVLYLPPMFCNKKMSMMFCPITQLVFFTMITSWLLLSWVGSCPVEYPYIFIGQLSSMMYFSYFLLMPWTFHTWNTLTMLPHNCIN